MRTFPFIPFFSFFLFTFAPGFTPVLWINNIVRACQSHFFYEGKSTNALIDLLCSFLRMVVLFHVMISPCLTSSWERLVDCSLWLVQPCLKLLDMLSQGLCVEGTPIKEKQYESTTLSFSSHSKEERKRVDSNGFHVFSMCFNEKGWDSFRLSSC